MPATNVFVRFVNWALIAAAACAIWFLSAYFFLGTEAIHEQLKAELPNSFFDRSLMPVFLAAIFSSLLWLANWLVVLFKIGPDKSYPLKIAGMAFAVCTAAGLVGVAVFFWG